MSIFTKQTDPVLHELLKRKHEENSELKKELEKLKLERERVAKIIDIFTLVEERDKAIQSNKVLVDNNRKLEKENELLRKLKGKTK